MRRSSFAGPLLLIAIGAALLAHNLYPALPLADYIARYWPYVLIAWGVLRLGEILIWAGQGKPLPASGVVGGEWFLVVFLVILGTTYHAVHGVSFGWPGRISLGGIEMFGEPFDYPVSGEKATSKTPQVVIEDLRGDVRVIGKDAGADADRVTVMGHKTVRALDQQGADTANRESPLEIAGDANRVQIRIHAEGVTAGRVTSTLDITVPKGASVEYQGRSGGVMLSNLAGAVAVKGSGSDIDLQDLGGAVSVAGEYSGNIDAQRLAQRFQFKSMRTELSVERIPGELHLELGDLTASNIIGPIRLNTRSHDVRLTDFTDSVDLTVTRGDLDLRPRAETLARIQAHATSGDIRLSLPANAQFQLEAKTRSGDISNGFGEALKGETSGRRQTLSGSVGSGPSIELETERGDIELIKAAPGSAQPAAPAAPKAPVVSPGAPAAPKAPALPRASQTPLQRVEQ